jgi:lysophospholipase L1-like esterase
MSDPTTPEPARRRLPALAAVLAGLAVVVGVGLGIAALAGRDGATSADGATLAPGAPGATGAAPGTLEPAAPPAASPSATTPPASATPAAGPTSAAPSPTAPAADGPTLAFLGDSLTVGVGAPPERGYAWQTAERLGWPIALVEGVSGSGFLAPGLGDPMPDRVPAIVAAQPDVVVVAGGTNDVFWGFPPADVGRAATDLLAELRAGLPDAAVVVLGPLPTSFDAVDAPDPTREAVRAAAEAAGVDYLDAGALVRAAVTDAVQWDGYISEDGLHPNELGYGVLADALAAEIGALVG